MELKGFYRQLNINTIMGKYKFNNNNIISCKKLQIN